MLLAMESICKEGEQSCREGQGLGALGTFGTHCPKEQDTPILTARLSPSSELSSHEKGQGGPERPWDTGQGEAQCREQPVPALSNPPVLQLQPGGRAQPESGTLPLQLSGCLNLTSLPRSHKSCPGHILAPPWCGSRMTPACEEFLLIQTGCVYITCGVIPPLVTRLKATACMCQACQISTCCILSV